MNRHEGSVFFAKSSRNIQRGFDLGANIVTIVFVLLIFTAVDGRGNLPGCRVEPADGVGGNERCTLLTSCKVSLGYLAPPSCDSEGIFDNSVDCIRQPRRDEIRTDSSR